MVSLRDKWFCESLVMASSKWFEFALERVDSTINKVNESTNVREKRRMRLDFEG